jgi:hypoxanthine phosphoribosyltransferase
VTPPPAQARPGGPAGDQDPPAGPRASGVGDQSPPPGRPPARGRPDRPSGPVPPAAGALAPAAEGGEGGPPVWVLLDRPTLQARVAALGRELRADYQGVEPILVTALRGGVVFLADLVRAAAMPCRVDFMALSRFDASEQTGVVRIVKDLDLDVSRAHVLVVEDIVDTGLTLTYLLRVLAARRPASLRVCALLDKRARRIVEVPLPYVGFEVPDVFLVGYGLDLDERERGRNEILAVADLAAVRRDRRLLDAARRPPAAR